MTKSLENWKTMIYKRFSGFGSNFLQTFDSNRFSGLLTNQNSQCSNIKLDSLSTFTFYETKIFFYFARRLEEKKKTD